MLGLLSGLFILFLSIYILFQGNLTGNIWLKLLGYGLFAGAGFYIALSRFKLNINKMNKYKEALRTLSKNPEDENLKNEAYDQGITYYKNKRDNGKVLPIDIMAIERDIDRVTQKDNV